MTGGTTEDARGATTRNLQAIGAMVLATVAFALGDAAMKVAAARIPTGEAVFLRSFGSVLLAFLIAHRTGVLAGFRRALVPLMGWRCIGDAGNSLCFQAALGRMPFADIWGILQLTPLTLTAASALFLGAAVGWRRWLAVTAGLIGALLVVRPGSSAFNAWALLAVASVLFGTLRDITTRRLDPKIPMLVIMILSQALVALSGLGLSAWQGWVTPSAADLGLIAIAAAFTLAGHLGLVASLRIGEIAAVAPFRYAGIVWAILLGYLFWGEWPDSLAMTGIAILIGAGLYTLYREQRVRVQRSSSPSTSRGVLS